MPAAPKPRAQLGQPSIPDAAEAEELEKKGLDFLLPPPPLKLDWKRQDIEQKLFFRGGRFTKVNGMLAFLLAVGLEIIFYAAILPIRESWFAGVFLERGPTPYLIVLLGLWSATTLLLKWAKLRLQRRALEIDIMPDDHRFVLSSNTVDQVTKRIAKVVDDPRSFLLFNRITVALSNLRNLGRVADLDDIVRAQAEQDASTVDTSYAMVQGFVWAIPVLGFIGTVLGLSEAIGRFGEVLESSDDMSQITEALKGVTGGLSTAFETTLIALVVALVIQLAITALKKSEEEFLDETMEYCIRNVVGRLRLVAR